MNRQSLHALIVTHSIPLADGLEALLSAIPQFDSVRVERTLEGALQQVGAAQPQVVLIDAALLGGPPRELMEAIVHLSPRTQRVILVDEVQDVNWVPGYVEAVLIKGGSPSALAAVLTHLLFSRGEDHEHSDSNR